nr:unnamed protein product [Callosobruchus chinensis]
MELLREPSLRGESEKTEMYTGTTEKFNNANLKGHCSNEQYWARAHQDWLLPQWRNVLFSDESRFGLVSDDYREWVWKERGGQNRLATAIGVAPYLSGKVLQVVTGAPPLHQLAEERRDIYVSQGDTETRREDAEHTPFECERSLAYRQEACANPLEDLNAYNMVRLMLSHKSYWKVIYRRGLTTIRHTKPPTGTGNMELLSIHSMLYNNTSQNDNVPLYPAQLNLKQEMTQRHFVIQVCVESVQKHNCMLTKHRYTLALIQMIMTMLLL